MQTFWIRAVILICGLAVSWWAYRFAVLLPNIPRPLNRRWVHVLLAGLIGVLAGAAMSGSGFPLAKVHDEFSYLLLADTLASGRLANPSPPHPEHFETFHVLVEPTYASKYQPGQGMILAIGRVLLGHAGWGSCLATGLAAASLCWMLGRVVGPMWGLVGGLLVALNYQFQQDWTHSYWGGQLALAGGALVIGSLGKFRRPPRLSDPITLAVGGGLLFWTRPYEGLVLFAFVMTLHLIKRWRRELSISGFAKKFAVPLMITAAPFLVFSAVYNKAVTGSAWVMPYALYESTHSEIPIFFWQQSRSADVPQIDVFESYQQRYLAEAETQMTLSGWWAFKTRAITDALRLISDRFHPLWVLPWLALFFVPLRDTWLPLAIVLLSWIANAVVLFSFPHYFAPFFPAYVWLSMLGLRHFARWLAASRPAAAAGIAVVVAQTLIFAGSLFWLPRDESQFAEARQDIASTVLERNGRGLVFVRYGADHNPDLEWVYNDASLAESDLIWARDLGIEQNRELMNAFPEHEPWILRVDPQAMGAMPYAEFFAQLDQALAVARSQPESAAAWQQAIALQGIYGDPNLALRWAQDLVRRNPADPAARELLMMVREQLGTAPPPVPLP